MRMGNEKQRRMLENGHFWTSLGTTNSNRTFKSIFQETNPRVTLNLHLFHILNHLGNDFFAILLVNQSKLGIEPVQSITGSLLRSSTLHPHACATMSSNPVLSVSINR